VIKTVEWRKKKGWERKENHAGIIVSLGLIIAKL
jgi:hypothetical protein